MAKPTFNTESLSGFGEYDVMVMFGKILRPELSERELLRIIKDYEVDIQKLKKEI